MEGKGWRFSWALEARRRSDFLGSGWAVREVGLEPPGWIHVGEGTQKLVGGDEQGNRGEREIHPGLKRMPFLEKGTGLSQA